MPWLVMSAANTNKIQHEVKMWDSFHSPHLPTHGTLRATAWLCRCQANERIVFMVGLLFERLPCKREFQTDLTQAFIDVHDRELDFFESFLYQDKKDSPRGGERPVQLRLRAETTAYVRLR